MCLDPAVLPPHCPAQETYFPSDIFNLGEDEVFVDCGAFGGDSIREFLARTGGNFKQIVAIEPDAANYERLVGALSVLNADKIKCVQQALGERNDEVRFNALGTIASGIGEGISAVKSVILDEILVGMEPSFIKMDIEGAELMALRGAAGILRTHRPILAICLYHAAEDLWEIPLWLKALVPEYQLFLRRYSDECWETVCYAVPRNRSVWC